MAQIHQDKGEIRQAETLLDEAERIETLVSGSNHIRTALLQTQRAELCFAQGRFMEAMALSENALATLQTLLSEEHYQMVSTYITLGECAAALGSYQDAYCHYDNATEILLHYFGANHSKIHDISDKEIWLQQIIHLYQNPKIKIVEQENREIFSQ